MNGKKMTRCDDCRELFEYFDNDSEVMHHTQEGKKLCSSCFAKILRQAREQYIKDHPCPFKEIVYPHEGNTGPYPRTTDMNRPETGCIMVWPGYQRYCIGERNCPIYNGGIEKCNG